MVTRSPPWRARAGARRSRLSHYACSERRAEGCERGPEGAPVFVLSSDPVGASVTAAEPTDAPAWSYLLPAGGRPSVTRIQASSRIAAASRCPAIRTSTAAFVLVPLSFTATSWSVAASSSAAVRCDSSRALAPPRERARSDAASCSRWRRLSARPCCSRMSATASTSASLTTRLASALEAESTSIAFFCAARSTSRSPSLTWMLPSSVVPVSTSSILLCSETRNTRS
jgi:hypothetical protein